MPTATVDLTPTSEDTSPVGSTGISGIAGTATLLVEPSRSQAVIIRGYLQKLGFGDVQTAAAGEKALEAARSARPKLVVSAMHLPDMTGVQLAQAMRAEPALSSVGFVLITSQADAQEADLVKQAGNVVRLPKPFGQEQLAQALAAATTGDVRQGSSVRPTLRTLLVDDSAAARAHVRNVLGQLGGHLVIEATDGAEAMALLQRETFDLVVTDYNMPRLDGKGLLEFIRQRSSKPAMPVIVVSTETAPEKLDPLRKLGVLAIFDKKFDAAAVRAVLERLG